MRPSIKIRSSLMIERRRAKGWNQTELARKVKVSLKTIQRAESGLAITVAKARRIAEQLDIAPHDFIEPSADELAREQVRGPLDDYFAVLREQFGMVQFLGLPHRRDEAAMPIADLFVEPELSQHLISSALPHAKWPACERLLDTLVAHPRLVILGDPGSGKSTIISALAFRLADERPNEWREKFPDHVPIPMIVRELPLKPEMSWSDLWNAFNRSMVGQSLSRADIAALEDQIAAGKAFFLLDGLDEVANLELRAALHRGVWEMLALNPENRFLATSRVIGYDALPFHKSPELLSLENASAAERGIKSANVAFRHGDPRSKMTLRYVAPFNDTRIGKFAENWYRQREPSQDRALANAGDLVKAVQKQPDVLVLARVPNLLTLMALIHRNEVDLPDGRARLYDRIAEAYLETIDNYRLLQERADSLTDKKRWLSRVAYLLQRRRGLPGMMPEAETALEILISRQDLHTEIEAGMRASGKFTSTADVDSFIDHIQRRSGLLVERAGGQFAFAHLSFLEYFAACRMVELHRVYQLTGKKPKLEEFADRAKDESWLETFVFFFELLVKEAPEEQVIARRTILGSDWEDGTPYKFSMPDDEKYPRLFFNREQVRVVLLARLACDRHSGLGELAKHARRACIAWELQRQLNPNPHWSNQPKVLRTFLSQSGEYGHQTLDEIVALAHEKGLAQLSLAGCRLDDVKPLSALTNLQALDLAGTVVSDVKPLAALTNLQALDLSGTAVSDVRPLAVLTELQVLELGGTAVSDVNPLAALTNLKRLSLIKTTVTDVNLLAALTNLQALDLEGTAVSDVKPLAALTNLRWLNLSRTAVSDVKTLGALTNLLELALNWTAVRDAQPLAALTNLQNLSLIGTPVSDTKPLAALTNLLWLDLAGTLVNEQVVAELKRSLPKLFVAGP